MSLCKRIFANIIIVVFLCAIFIDAIPSTCKAHTRLKEAIDPALDATGLWQQTWQLFAPEPDRLNTRISAVITLIDGREIAWNSPDWSSMGVWEQFTTFRRAEYFDNLRLNSYKPAWEPFARYLAKTTAAREETSVQSVALTRHWVEVSEFTEDGPLTKTGGDWSNPSSYQFFVWKADE